MANEYLKRTPTSTGNRKVFTWSGWAKHTAPASAAFLGSWEDATHRDTFRISSEDLDLQFGDGGTNYGTNSVEKFRDSGSWSHYMISVDTTQEISSNRTKIFVNGALVGDDGTVTDVPQNQEVIINKAGRIQLIGARTLDGSNPNISFDGEKFDVFFVDGQALTPEVFGFYKEGKGYQSSGTTNATDFRSGQWSPRSPKSIKYEINRSGGFGTNGYYLPMNDSSNPGADFHCAPNSIIKLKGEDLPQPRNGAPDTSDAYVSELRDDPYAANLILACPFISGGYGQNGTVSTTISGLGDYHIALGGSSSVPAVNFLAGAGTQATITPDNGLYYGSSLDVTASTIRPRATVGTAFEIDGDFTIEFWAYINSFDATGSHLFQYDTDAGQTGWAITGDNGGARFLLRDSNNIDYQIEVPNVYTTGQWNHWAGVYEQSENRITLYVNGVAVGTNTAVPSNYTSIQYSNLNRLHIGSNTGDGSRAMLGYMQDLRVYKGVAKYKGGFDVAKPYTPVGIESWRAVPDTTANNFATLNPLIGAGTAAGEISPALLSGNLYLDLANQTWAPANIGVSTGKWYAEFMCLNGIQGSNIGVCGDALHGKNNQASFNAAGVSYVRLAGSSITKQYNSTSSVAGSLGYSSGDIVSVTIDVPNREFKFYKNNTLIFTDTSASSYSPLDTNYYFTPFRTNDGANPVGSEWSDVIANFGQNPTFCHTKAVFGKRVNTGNADSIWHQSSTGGTHTDWTISADGTNLQVTVAAGAYARAYLLASDGTIDPKKRYLVTFDYVTGPANLGVAASNSGGSIQYLTAVDGSAAPNGLSSGNSYAFEFQGDQFAFTGFNGLTYELDNVIISEIGNTYTDDSGKGKFSYQPPTGFLALCEDNLPTPAIADPGDYMKSVLYTGSETAKAVNDVGFQPDLVWIKERDGDFHNAIYDSVRGPKKSLSFSRTDIAEQNESDGLNGFSSTGFDLSSGTGFYYVNRNAQPYIAWCWKAGGNSNTFNVDGTGYSTASAAGLDSGTITPTGASVGTDQGFSILTYTGNGTAGANISHGLSKAPEIMFHRSRDNGKAWYTITTAIDGSADYLYLSSPIPANNSAVTAPTSNLMYFTSSNESNNLNEDYVVYMWHSVENFSKIGTYVGNGDDDGPMIVCGFKPAWVIVKRVTTGGNEGWPIYDNVRGPNNPNTKGIYTNSQLAENDASGRYKDFLSNGFKIRGTSGEQNTSGITYLYMAFAESPFQTANAK